MQPDLSHTTGQRVEGQSHKQAVLTDTRHPTPDTRSSAVSRSLLNCVPYAVLLAFTSLLLSRLLWNQTLYWGDLLLYFQPMYRFGRQELRAGHLPLWNPYVLCGQPYIGNPQMGIFYPATALLAWLSPWRYIAAALGLHLFLCGAFTYRFLTRWTVSRLCALTGALVFEGSGCLLGRLQFPPMIFSIAYFPLLLICLDACVDRRGLHSYLALAGTAGLLFLAAHPQMAYLSLGIGLIYTVVRLRSRTQNKPSPHNRIRSLLSRAIPIASAVMVGMLLASIQLLPTLQVVLESPREELSSAQANRFFLSPEQLLSLVAPHFFGSPAAADYWGTGNAWEPALFVGWLPLLLIGYAVITCGNERVVRFWALTGLIAIWLAIGNMGGLYWLAFHSIPGLSNFHDPARFLILTVYAFAALTAIGLDALRSRIFWFERPALSISAILVALPLLYYAHDWLPTASPEALNHVPAIVSYLRISRKSQPNAGRTYLPAHELYWRHYITEGYSDYGSAKARALAAELDTFMPNLGMRYGIQSASAYEPVPLSGPASIDGLSRMALRRNEPNLERLLALTDSYYLLLPRPYHLYSPGLAQVTTNSGASQGNTQLRLYTNRACPLRAWIVRKTLHVIGNMRAAAALAAPQFDPKVMAIVSSAISPNEASIQGFRESGIQEKQGTGNWELGTENANSKIQIPKSNIDTSDGSVEIALASETTTIMQVDAGKRPGYLVVASAAFPGWYARVDGLQKPLLRTDGALIGLYLPPGKHYIEIDYRPDTFVVGQYLTLITCSILAAGAILVLMSCRKSRWQRHSSVQVIRSRQ